MLCGACAGDRTADGGAPRADVADAARVAPDGARSAVDRPPVTVSPDVLEREVAVPGAGLESDPPVGRGDTTAATPRTPPPRGERTQFVLFSIDTTPSYQRPRGREVYESLYRALNRGRDPTAPPNSYTLFIASGGLQFAPDRENLTEEEQPYRGVEPRLAPVYRYAERLDRIRDKAANIRELAELGVEIASHGVRHTHGGGWSRDEWRFELGDHRRILALAGIPQPAGFRAPFLEGNSELYPVLQELGMTYDSSQVGGRCWPTRHPGTRIWVFGVPSVALPDGRQALWFDDNLETLLRPAAAADGVSGEADIRAWMEDAFFAAGVAEFTRRYEGSRAPFLVSGHGGFRKATIRLLNRVCDLPDVRCAAFREAAAYLDAHPELEGVCE